MVGVAEGTGLGVKVIVGVCDAVGVMVGVRANAITVCFSLNLLKNGIGYCCFIHPGGVLGCAGRDNECQKHK